MSETNPRARQVLEDMLHGASKALRYYDETGDGRRADDRTVDAILRRIGILGEAAKRMPVDERPNYDQIKWRQIIGMRDRVIHDHDDVDLNILEMMLRDDLPQLIRQLRQVGIASS